MPVTKMKMTVNLGGLLKWSKAHPKQSLQGYFSMDGHELTHTEVLRLLEWAVAHDCKRDVDVPAEILEKIINGQPLD